MGTPGAAPWRRAAPARHVLQGRTAGRRRRPVCHCAQRRHRRASQLRQRRRRRCSWWAPCRAAARTRTAAGVRAGRRSLAARCAVAGGRMVDFLRADLTRHPQRFPEYLWCCVAVCSRRKLCCCSGWWQQSGLLGPSSNSSVHRRWRPHSSSCSRLSLSWLGSNSRQTPPPRRCCH